MLCSHATSLQVPHVTMQISLVPSQLARNLAQRLGLVNNCDTYYENRAPDKCNPCRLVMLTPNTTAFILISVHNMQFIMKTHHVWPLHAVQVHCDTSTLLAPYSHFVQHKSLAQALAQLLLPHAPYLCNSATLQPYATQSLARRYAHAITVQDL